MNLNKLKKLTAALLCGALFAVVVNAQPAGAPDAEVLPDGSLKLPDGTIIPVPAGTVDAQGNLVIGETTIPKPTATLQADGSLRLADGTVLPVPDLPEGGAFIVSWFGPDFYDYDDAKGPDVDQWYFSFTFKNLYHFASTNWFYSEELNTYLYFAPNSGLRSLEGVWVYTNKLFPASTAGTWMYLGRTFGWKDLSAAAGPGQAGNQTLDGFIYVDNMNGYHGQTGSGFFFFSEYADGNFIIKVGDPGGSWWIKLTNPVP